MRARKSGNADERVALVDIARVGERAGAYPSSDERQTDERPTTLDLATHLRFSPRTGRIWLGEQRMLLLHSKTFASLRHELIERLGFSGTRAMLMRIGYASGAHDAALVRRTWPSGDEVGAFTAGTRLHALEGIVKVTALHVTSDIAHGYFRGEYLWEDSLEAAEFASSYGIAREPVCWMQIGYASGYASAFLGKRAIFRELECAAMGAPACRILGQPADAWGEPLEELQFLDEEQPAARPGARRSTVPARAPEGAAPVQRARATQPSYGMVGFSAAFIAARHRIERVARTPATVLFVGESGVGKELFAKAVHEMSPRRDRPLVAVNCAAIPDTLIESELFGVERGAFTGASTSRPGRFERASGGTLFLDEISSLSLIAQGKLMRAIQEKEIDRVGGTRAVKVDARIVAASNMDLYEEVRAGRFREDLYFRLNVFPIRLPPLRERRDDIPLLLDHFLSIYNGLYGKSVAGFHPRAIETLLNYNYPGNIRELQNIVERGVISASDGGSIDLQDIFQPGDYPQGIGLLVSPSGALVENAAQSAVGDERAGKSRPTNGVVDRSGVIDERLFDRPFSLVDHEREIYRRALARNSGNVSAAARALGLTRAQLAYRLKSNSIAMA